MVLNNWTDRKRHPHVPRSINVTVNDIAAILHHDHHAESGFAVRPAVLFTCFALLLDVPFIMSLIAEEFFHGKSGQTVKVPVLQHIIHDIFYVRIT